MADPELRVHDRVHFIPMLILQNGIIANSFTFDNKLKLFSIKTKMSSSCRFMLSAQIHVLFLKSLDPPLGGACQ